MPRPTPTPDPSPQGGGEKRPIPIKTTPYPKPTPFSSPPSAPMPYFVRSRCRMDRERGRPGGRKAFCGSGVTCGRALEEAEAIGVPLAGGSHGDTCKASHRAGSRFRKRHRGGRRQLRSGPVADMTCSTRHVRVRAGTSRTTPAVSPDRGRSNPDGDTTPGVRGTACRMRTSSGDNRAAREPRHRFLSIP
ncbi:hypothetical protein SAMN05877838_1028 [Hoeflea halophila]|uniref:Uncharacterized protein n=1 Tax=Hoeflea halophila TaxID=714899 RepID=A0A286I4Y0_9HYPH|nr:hypothetical protein SAMN05877838_1028 [Hoeflea halophila]